MNISASEENYLKAIFHLSVTNEMVTTNELASELGSRPASITDMTKRLSAKGWLHYKPYYGFQLTAEGKKIALGIIRRHRLWEFFLAEKLGFDWKEVHALAEELEHISNKKLIDKLDAYLEFPSFDPHGDPIPDSRGRMKSSQRISLLQVPLDQKATVSRVSNQSAELLELLHQKKIVIGTEIEVKKHFPFDKSLQVRIQTRTEMISEQLAQNIFVSL